MQHAVHRPLNGSLKFNMEAMCELRVCMEPSISGVFRRIRSTATACRLLPMTDRPAARLVDIVDAWVHFNRICISGPPHLSSYFPPPPFMRVL